MPQLVIQFSTASSIGAAKWLPFLDASMWIRRLCHSPFSHVDFVLEDGNLLGASDNATAPVIEGNARGVAVRPPDYQPFGIRRRAYIETDHADAVLGYARSQIGKPFDKGAIAPCHFLSDKFSDRNWAAEDKWFCAELACRACEVGELFSWDLIGIKNRVTPSDLLLMLNPLMDVERFWQPVEGMKMGLHER